MGSQQSIIGHHRLNFAAPLAAPFSEQSLHQEEQKAMEAYYGVDAGVLSAVVGGDSQSPVPPPNEGVALILEGRAWEMPQLISHMEIPSNKKCQPVLSQAQQRCNDNRKCVICACINCTKFHQGFLLGFHEAVEAVKVRFAENPLQGILREAMMQFANFVQNEPVIRRNLSHWGAVRITKERALRILGTPESLNNYFINLQTDGTEVGYVFSQDMGNHAYAVPTLSRASWRWGGPTAPGRRTTTSWNQSSGSSRRSR